MRSGSKVGSKYKGQIASTNDAYCPTLKGAVKTALPPDVEAVMEIVIDGLTADGVAKSMRAGLHAICEAARRQASPMSPPAITAAISGRIISISRRSSRECADARTDDKRDRAVRPFAAHAARLAGLKPKEIAALAHRHDARAARRWAIVFKLKGNDAATLRLDRHRCQLRPHRPGMTEGEISWTATPGAYLGAGMRGGTVTRHRRAGPFAGASMAGRRDRDRAATRASARAALSWARPSACAAVVMTIGGNAGAMLGERMRRGLILVSGKAGDYAGARMIAGTILIKGKVGRFAGYGLRRGSLILAKQAEGVCCPPSAIAACSTSTISGCSGGSFGPRRLRSSSVTGHAG